LDTINFILKGKKTKYRNSYLHSLKMHNKEELEAQMLQQTRSLRLGCLVQLFCTTERQGKD
jgi:hypothetical protein